MMMPLSLIPAEFCYARRVTPRLRLRRRLRCHTIVTATMLFAIDTLRCFDAAMPYAAMPFRCHAAF